MRLRYFNVFGPRQSPSSPYAASVPIVVKAMLAGQAPVLVEDAYEYHDFLYVDDAVHAALLAAAEDRAPGKVYNIARGRPVNLLGVAAVVNEILNAHIEPVYSRRRMDDYQAQAVSVVKAEAELGFCARTDLKQGLRALIDYYTKQTEHIRADAPVDPAAVDSRHILNKNRAASSDTGKTDEPGT